ncbi:MAG: hypothetical protein WBW92_00190 [Rhodanobacteraceae bacterium]
MVRRIRSLVMRPSRSERGNPPIVMDEQALPSPDENEAAAHGYESFLREQIAYFFSQPRWTRA